MAKIIIIALKINRNIQNLLTTIKVTSYDEKQENLKLVEEITCDNTKSILVFEGYLCNELLALFQTNICNKSIVSIDNQEILYEVDKIPRSSFLLQREDFYADKYNQITSPFYSNCYLEENWNRNLNIKNLWLELCKQNYDPIKPHLDINLEYFIDKIGNVLKFVQVNEVDVSVVHQNEKIITLGFKINEDIFDKNYVINKYIVTIEVISASDTILKKSFEINKRFIDIELQDSDDNIHIEIYNLNNNKCVYKRNMKFWGNGTKIVHQLKKDITTIPNVYKIENLKQNPVFEISSLENTRTKWTRKIKRKDDSEFVRFDDTEKYNAYEYLIKTLINTAKYKGTEENLPEYIYLADPYLFSGISLDLYMKLLNKLNNIEFRLIGCKDCIPEFLIKEMQKNKELFKNVKIKSIRKRETDESGNLIPPFQTTGGKFEYKTRETFHDRFIATKHLEYGFTNSINNFRKGVTFFRSFDVYFDDAEELWNIPASNNNYVIEVI